MPFIPIRTPQPGSLDEAAQRIYEILERERRNRHEARRGKGIQLAQASPPVVDEAETAPMPIYPASQTHPYPPPSLALRQSPESRNALVNWIIDRFEGGYRNDPLDPGGPTNFGITSTAIADYRNSFDKSFTLAPDQISRDQALRIYDSLIRKYRLDQIADPDIRAQVIDMMINPGIESAGKMLLDVLEEQGHDVRINPADNVIGSRAPGAIRGVVDRSDEAELARIYNALNQRRHQYYEDRIVENPQKKDYRDSWMRRIKAFRFLPTGRQR